MINNPVEHGILYQIRYLFDQLTKPLKISVLLTVSVFNVCIVNGAVDGFDGFWISLPITNHFLITPAYNINSSNSALFKLLFYIMIQTIYE